MQNSRLGKLPRELLDQISAYVFMPDGVRNITIDIVHRHKHIHNEDCDSGCIHRLLNEGWMTACKQSRSESALLISGMEFKILHSLFSYGNLEMTAFDNFQVVNNLLNCLSPDNARTMRSFHVDFGQWKLPSCSPPGNFAQAWRDARACKARMHSDGKLRVRFAFFLPMNPRGFNCQLSLPLGDADAIRSEIRKAANREIQREKDREKKDGPVQFPLDVKTFVENMDSFVTELGE